MFFVFLEHAVRFARNVAVITPVVVAASVAKVFAFGRSRFLGRVLLLGLELFELGLERFDLTAQGPGTFGVRLLLRR